MNKWKNLCVAAVALAGLSALSGCAATTVKNNAAVCRLRFDYEDEGLAGLNVQNLRTLVSFQEICSP